MAFFQTQEQFNKTWGNKEKSPAMKAFYAKQKAMKERAKAREDKVFGYAKSFANASGKVMGAMTGNVGKKLGTKLHNSLKKFK